MGSSPSYETYTTDTLFAILDTAFTHNICVKAWLGYGEVLFISYSVLSCANFITTHGNDVYELQTHFADWFVEQNSIVMGTNLDNRSKAEETIQLLIGRYIINWKYYEHDFSLHIEFSEGWRLKIQPWALEDLSHEDEDTDAWVLAMPLKKYYAVACNGKLTLQKQSL